MSDPYAAFESLKFDRPAERVLRLRLVKTGKLHAVVARMHKELADVWRSVDTDPEVSAVILTGAGEAFSAGGDFEVLESLYRDQETRLTVWKEARDIVYNVINCSKPVISAIRGPAVGAGLAAALVADISIASTTARFIDGHTRLGVAAGDHSVIVWPLLVGMAKAKYYLLTCEALDGVEAERIGLVSLCVEDEALDQKALDVAAKLARGAPGAIRLTKYALNNWLRLAGPSFDASLALEFLCFTGDEVREGIASLKEKRRAEFPKDSPI
jgi:enoyl-CoA hydratase